MLRRVSPEGRAIAHRQRIERQRRTTRQVMLCVLLALAIGLVFYGLSLAGVEIGSGLSAAGAILFVAGCIAILAGFRPRSIKVKEFPSVQLAAVPGKVGAWLEEQRKALPPPALPIVDSLTRRLSMLGPQLESVKPSDPASGAIRKLVAVELPELVGKYLNIPSSAAPEGTAQLVQGLKIIDGEIERMGNDLASGSFDALATQNRYLQLKYDAGLGEI